MIRFSAGIESVGIQFFSVKNIWLKSVIFSLGFILKLESSMTRTSGDLSSPNFSRKQDSNFSHDTIVWGC
jgi:hypothetical protein